MTDDEIITRLPAVRGIGRWTVEMLLLFDLGRPDVWPVDDGVRKGFAKTFGRRKLPSPKQLVSRDIMKVPAAEILETQNEMTVIGGEIIYSR
jgi:3-methyladenine DNA glycosylase/8-oxoguanine DNA glycosylase